MQTRLARGAAELWLPLFKWRNAVGVCRESSYSIFRGEAGLHASALPPSLSLSVTTAGLVKPGRSNCSNIPQNRFRTSLKLP